MALPSDPSPFSFSGGEVGILLIHGFTGSPAELRPLGHYLHGRRLTVAAPLLPGHGVTPAALNQQRRQDWIACMEQALTDLQRQCKRVFVVGLSLSALLTLMLAGRQHNLAGIIAYSPAIAVNDPRAYFLLCRSRGAALDVMLLGLPHRCST
jgi:carboxylesterase